MINIQITMISGETYRVSNPVCTSVKDFIKNVLAPYGHVQTFVEIFQGEMINSSAIQSIREITDKEIEVEYEEIYNEIQENNTPVEAEDEEVESEEIEESKE